MLNTLNPIDHVAWVRRGNSRWIVHHGLGKNAQAYMEHLEREDPERLARSCRNAYLMVHRCDPMEDPKPWFYAGLFSLVKPEEAKIYLANHWLVTMCVGLVETPEKSLIQLDAVCELTVEKIRRIREAVDLLPVYE
ncbi:MAG TPA: hypothetical protein VGH19_16195 [Verrucomicrobiae bacterium]